MALACDVCGSKLVMGTGGMAVCESCGMEHGTSLNKTLYAINFEIFSKNILTRKIL